MSFKGTMFHYILKYRHLMKGKLKAEVIDENSDINLIRRESEEAAEKLVKKLRELGQADFQDFYAEWVKVENAPENKIVYIFIPWHIVLHYNRSTTFINHTSYFRKVLVRFSN